MSEQGDAVFEKMAAHFKAKQIKSAAVPEWGDVVLYANPITIKEAQQIAGFQDRPTKEIGEAAVETLILIARDEDGNKLFDRSHKPKILRMGDFSVLSRVIAELVSDMDTEVEDLQRD